MLLHKALMVILPIILAAGIGAQFFLNADAAPTDPPLKVEILAADNLVVDSNVTTPATYAPSVATVAGKFCNTSATNTLTEVWGFIGDFDTVAANRKPGIYPSRTPGGSLSGTYAFQHLGGAADASRYIGTLAPGACSVQYWHFKYPQCELTGGAAWNDPPCEAVTDPVWLNSNDPTDDLYLYLDMWATGYDGANPKTVDDTKKMTMRQEISAMANKIEPNPNGSWFNTNTSVVVPGDVITSNGVRYELGNVNKGFDNDIPMDGLYDYNAWMQPVGDPNYDPSCFRLIRTSGFLTITRSGGNPNLVIPFTDQLYFTNLPEDNTGITGNVYYTFMAMAGACTANLSPYQEVASGADNEKFNGDFGSGIPPVQSSTPQVVITKTGPNTTSTSSEIVYSVPFYNDSTTNNAGLTLSTGGIYAPMVVQDTIPTGLQYKCGSANLINIQGYTPSSPAYKLVSSIDSGKTWVSGEPTGCPVNPTSTGPNNLIVLQWWLTDSLPKKTGSPEPGATATFTAIVPGTFISSGNSPLIDNCANLSFGGGASLGQACKTTLVTGSSTISGYVWEDINRDGAIAASGEPGIYDRTIDPDTTGVDVYLYFDSDGDGVLDAGEPLIDTQQSNSTTVNPNYTFSNLPDGKYIVKVSTNDVDLPDGYARTTPEKRAVTISGSNITGQNFGFGPVLNIDKHLESTDPAYVGENVLFHIDVSNQLPGDGTANGYCKYYIYPQNATTGSGNAAWTTPENALFAPDGAYARTNLGNSTNDLDLTGYNLSGMSAGISSVQIYLYLQENISLDPSDTLKVDVTHVPATYDPMTAPLVYAAADFPGAAGTEYLKTITLNVPAGGWNWTYFAAGTDFDVYLGGKDNGQKRGEWSLDTAAIVINTTDPSCGGSDTTIVTLPLTDTYDADLLQFVSANPPASSVSVTGSAPSQVGTILWDNVGPLYAGGSRTIEVNFKALATVASPGTTNTAKVEAGNPPLFGNGRKVNTDSDTANVIISASGSISGRTFANSTSGTTTWVVGTGYDLTNDTFIPNATLELWACVSNATGQILPPSAVDDGQACDGAKNGGTWTKITETVSASDGSYSFPGLRDGFYNVKVATGTLPASFNTCSLEATYAGNGAGGSTCDNQWNNPTANLSTANFNSVDNSGGSDNITAVSFGYRAASGGDVVGFVWNDINNDGIWQTATEEPIKGVRIYLCGSSPCNSGTDIAYIDTNAAGYYSFNQTAGSYVLGVEGTSTSLSGMTQSGDPDLPNALCTTCDGEKAAFSIVAQQISGQYNFGYTGGLTVSGTVYTDWNGSGNSSATPDSGEEGISGVVVELYRDLDGDGVIDAGEPMIRTTTTDSSGNYSFTGVPGGNNYIVKYNTSDIPAGYTQKDDNDESGVCTTCNSLASVALTTSSAANVNAGYKPSGFGSIGDLIWRDTDADGVKDASESGISGVAVYLYQDEDGDGIIDTTDALVATTTTSSSGAYTFSNLPAGKYQVVVPNTNLSQGGALYGLSNTNDGGDNNYKVTLAASENFTGADLGYIGNAIGDYVWSDTNGNGQQDSGESGISSVTVRLYTFTDANGNNYYDPGETLGTVQATTATDANGYYLFTAVPTGSYAVVVDTTTGGLSNYILTSDPDSITAAIPCPNPATPATDYCDSISGVRARMGIIDYSSDFGYRLKGVIGDYVWLDVDNDGVQDVDESGISGVTVTLLDCGADKTCGNGDDSSYVTTTNAQGAYTFSGLDVSHTDFRVTVTNPNLLTYGWTYDPDAGITGGNASPDGITNFNLNTSGQASWSGADLTCSAASNCNNKLDFGLRYLSGLTIDGKTFFDALNDGGVYNSGQGDTPLGGIPVYLYRCSDVSCTTMTLYARTNSNTSGDYSFNNLPSGDTYRVVIGSTSTALTGLRQTLEPDDTNCTDGGSTCDNSKIFASMAANNTANWGFSGSVDFGDLSEATGYRTTLANQGAGHILTGSTLWLGPSDSAPDAENNGQPNTTATGDDVNGTSDENGIVQYGDWVAGGTGLIGAKVSGQNGYLVGFYDWNNDGDFNDSGETIPYGNVANNTLNGPNSANFLSVNIPSNAVTTSPLNARFRLYDSTKMTSVSASGLAQGGEVEDYLFSWSVTNVGSIGNSVWLDEDGNGLQDPGETGIPNVTVELWNSGHTAQIATAVTDANGNYIFKDVPPGTYQVDVLGTSLPSGLVQTQVPGGSGDLINKSDPYTIIVTANGESMQADFGYNWVPSGDTDGNTGTGAIGNRLWIDDGDGIQEPGEPGLYNVTVELITPGTDGILGTADDVVAATTTSSYDGSYIFDNLAAGAYAIRVNSGNNPTGYTQTGDPDLPGALCATCDNHTTTAILLAPGDVYTNADFGYTPTAGNGGSIGNTLWVDSNRDNVIDAGEPRLPGVTVSLIRDLDGDGIRDAGEPIIATDITDASGQYLFTNVPVADGLGTDDYLVWVNDTENVLYGLTPTYDSNGAATPNISAVSNLAPAGDTNQNFAYVPQRQESGKGLIGDTVFYDRDANGAFSAGEGMEGVRVNLYSDTNADGNYDAGEPLLASAYTNENGQYFFGNLPTNHYVVRVDTSTLPAGLVNTVDKGDATLDEGGLLLAASGIDLTQDFGYRTTASPNTISGTLWRDTNADGALDGSETGRFQNVTIVLRNSSGNIMGTTTTDSSGNYTFGNLPDGTYTVHVSDENNNQLDGYWHSLGATPGNDNNSQTDLYSVTVSGGQTNSTGDFAYYSSPAQIGNYVWLDRDGDGVQDVDEPGIRDVEVVLTITYPNATVTTIKTKTGLNGAYSFGNLLLDEDFNSVSSSTSLVYNIGVSTPPAMTASTEAQSGSYDQVDGDSDGASENATILKGEVDTSYDFGFTGNLDLGDLPTPTYSTLFANGPANVVFPDGADADSNPDTTGGAVAVWLGNSPTLNDVDTEPQGQPDANALGDGADENGLWVKPLSWQPNQSTTFTITVNSSAATTVYYGLWIDWDMNGTFEQFYNDPPISTSSPAQEIVTVNVPAGYTLGNVVFVRLRVYSGPLLATDSEGTLLNGETEDYRLLANPTSVTLTDFGIQAAQGGNLLTWKTALETRTLGYNLYRASSPTGPRVKINASLIPPQLGQPGVRSYQYLDKTIKTGAVYYYWLEAVSSNGSETFGPVHLSNLILYMPFIVAP